MNGVNSNTSGRMRQKMAKILCVCISKERKTCSQNIHECEADLQGLVGDVHYGMGGRKQVSLLPYEKVKEIFRTVRRRIQIWQVWRKSPCGGD